MGTNETQIFMEPIEFKISAKTSAYDDGKFVQWRILMRSGGRLAGIEDGPTRLHRVRDDAVKDARKRVAVLKKQRLFVVPITKKNIDHGEARNCHSCAIAQALWQNQERMGLPRFDVNFRVSPYAAFAHSDGLVIEHKYGSKADEAIAPENLPLVVSEYRWKGKTEHYDECMVDWAMDFDDWAESQSMSLAEWRQRHGYKDGERPIKPGPACFVLNLDEFKRI